MHSSRICTARSSTVSRGTPLGDPHPWGSVTETPGQRPPLDRDLPGQTSPRQRPPWKETPLGQRPPPLDRDPHPYTETPHPWTETA